MLNSSGHGETTLFLCMRVVGLYEQKRNPSLSHRLRIRNLRATLTLFTHTFLRQFVIYSDFQSTGLYTFTFPTITLSLALSLTYPS